MHTKLKRFLIFTSLYNMGFLSCFFWVPNSYMLNGFVAFFIIYVINSFCLVVSFSLLTNKYQNFVVVDIKELSSVLPQDRRYAFALIYFLLVISGLPPFSFFFVKYYLFFKFAHVGIGYVIVLLLTSAIAIFYYVRTIRIILEARRPTFLLAIRSLGLGFFALVSVLNIYFLFFAEHLIEILNTLPI
jgi:NADH-quinone oxidoreductase subunit N